jgi:hypothetical protein
MTQLAVTTIENASSHLANVPTARNQTKDKTDWALEKVKKGNHNPELQLILPIMPHQPNDASHAPLTNLTVKNMDHMASTAKRRHDTSPAAAQDFNPSITTS